MSTLLADQTSIEKVIHDIRGPLVNLAGFQSELNDSIRKLQELIEMCCDDLPESRRQEFRRIFEQDIDPCLNFTSTSLVRLREQINYMEQNFIYS